MFLSKLILNPSSKQARTDLASPYQLHATLCHAFQRPQECQGKERGETVEPFLWRLEEGKTSAVLVQSFTLPELEKLLQRFPSYFAKGRKPNQSPWIISSLPRPCASASKPTPPLPAKVSATDCGRKRSN